MSVIRSIAVGGVTASATVLGSMHVLMGVGTEIPNQLVIFAYGWLYLFFALYFATF